MKYFFLRKWSSNVIIYALLRIELFELNQGSYFHLKFLLCKDIALAATGTQRNVDTHTHLQVAQGLNNLRNLMLHDIQSRRVNMKQAKNETQNLIKLEPEKSQKPHASGAHARTNFSAVSWWKYSTKQDGFYVILRACHFVRVMPRLRVKNITYAQRKLWKTCAFCLLENGRKNVCLFFAS